MLIASARCRALRGGVPSGMTMLPDGLEGAIEFADYALRFRFNYFRGFEDPALGLVLCHRHEFNRQALVQLALSGSDLAHRCLVGMESFLADIDDKPPRWLRAYTANVLVNGPPKKSRGRDRFANLIRDTAIGQSVEMVTAHHDLRPTRNKSLYGNSDAKPSGASLVAIALERAGLPLHESKVERCWRDVWTYELTIYDREVHVLADAIAAARKRFGCEAWGQEVCEFIINFLHGRGFRIRRRPDA
jgi:hypothetical protein